MIRKIINRIKLYSSPKRELYLYIKSILGVYPSNLKLYDLAFIHKSKGLKDSLDFPVNNERLEYLGDAVLDTIIADYLYLRFPNKDEGYLTQVRSRLVSRATLSKLTTSMDLGKFIQCSSGSSNESSSIYGDAFEALIGALYLDKGYVKTRRVVIEKILRVYVDISDVEQNNDNYKSRLIEWGQKNRSKVEFNTYEIQSEGSVPNQFGTKITLEGKLLGKGRGSSKKESQQSAAQVALEKLNSDA